jgi:hypothetical protein
VLREWIPDIKTTQRQVVEDFSGISSSPYFCVSGESSKFAAIKTDQRLLCDSKFAVPLCEMCFALNVRCADRCIVDGRNRRLLPGVVDLEGRS